MNNEVTRLEMRARKHAALGDPARLRMLDLLVFGDLSPSELRDELGLPSNLVAHHLNVLEREQIIDRVRSEGDGRRTYVRLNHDVLGQLGSFAAGAAQRVVFVCSANSARSQLAEALWREASDIPATSGGTHPTDHVADGAIAVAHRHGLTLDDSKPKDAAGLVQDTDFVITVCDRAHEEFPGATVHWSVPDPVPQASAEAFEEAFGDLARRVSQLAPRMLALT